MGSAERMNVAHQQGVVLLSVLLIMALLTAIAYQLMGRHSLVVAQARQTFAGDQALAYAMGGEAFARQLLYEDWSQTGQGVDDLTESWAQPLTPFEVENGFLEIQIRDLNACFNLNSLASTQTDGNPGAGAGAASTNLQRLKTLLRNQNLPETIADYWLDWIDSDQSVSNFGAEDGDYLLAENAYRSANRMAGHISELRLLLDMDAETLRALSKVACVLPSEELKLNVNTASAAALASLNSSLVETQMLSMTESVRTYTSVNEVTTEYQELLPAIDALTVTSEYFLVQVRAEVDGNLSELSSVLHRNLSDGSITLKTRDFGQSFISQFEDVENSRVPGEE